MHRFFINKEDIKGKRIIVKGEDVKHISNALRLRSGGNTVLCDGEGKDYIVSIMDIDKNSVITEILNIEESVGEIDLDITIYQGMPKSTKMEFVIQKCTELGANKIVPIVSERTVVKLASINDEIKKINRWQKIAEEAAKQSNRGRIPCIGMPMSFENAVTDSLNKDLSLIPYEKEKDISLKDILSNARPESIGVFIGPEGGFEDKEVQLAIDNKAKVVTLGNRILRTETAALTVLSCILYEYNQF